MPERIDRVTVSTSRTNVEIPWASRDALLAELGEADSNAGIVKAFTAVGAERKAAPSRTYVPTKRSR